MPSSSLALNPPNPAAQAGIAQRTSNILPYRFTPELSRKYRSKAYEARLRNNKYRLARLKAVTEVTPKAWKPRLSIKHMAPLLQGAIDKVRELEARLDAPTGEKEYRRLKLASYLGPETVPPKGKGSSFAKATADRTTAVVSDGSSTPETSPRMLEPIGPAPRK
jgi:hypothetical protein